MSRRVLIETSMKNAKALDRMVEKMGLKGVKKNFLYTISSDGSPSQGGSFFMSRWVPTTINLTTGQMTGDEDNKELYDTFRQNYAVEEYLLAAEAEGYILESQEVLPDGRIALNLIR